MSRGTAMEQTAQRVDRLVRSLVGVDDVRPAWDAAGRLRVLHVLRNGQVTDQQLIRNIVSGLQAGFAIRLESAAIRIYADAAVFATAVAALETAAAADVRVADVAPPAPNGAAKEANGNGTHAASNNGARNGTTGHAPAAMGFAPAVNGNGNARANGNGHVARPVAPAAVRPPGGDAGPAEGTSLLRLERLTMERHGVMLRCRVMLALEEQKYSAIAEVPEGPGVEAELAARVTLDALRAGALTCAHLEGVGLTTIAARTYVVAAIRAAGAEHARASAAPMVESMARSAAEAVLQAVGPITAAHRTAAERRLGRN